MMTRIRSAFLGEYVDNYFRRVRISRPPDPINAGEDQNSMLKAAAYCQWPLGSMDLNKTAKWDSLDSNPVA